MAKHKHACPECGVEIRCSIVMCEGVRHRLCFRCLWPKKRPAASVARGEEEGEG